MAAATNHISSQSAAADDQRRHHPWVSFKTEPNGGNGKNTVPQMRYQQPTALLEPLELNEIPLDDNASGLFGAANNNKSASLPSNTTNADVEKIPAEPTPSSRTTTTVANIRNATAASQKRGESRREVILEVGGTPHTAAGTSTANGSSNSNEEFKNGKLLTSVFPINSHCAWLTPPKYGYQMPNVLANKQNMLPASVYTDVIRTISRDLRFFSYAVLYSRITPVWVIMAIIVLLLVLASTPQGGYPIMIFALIWMAMLVLGVLFCVLIRKYIVLSLRSLLKDINKITFLQYRVMVGVQDKGQLSCHKVVLMFIYYDPAGCRDDVQKLLRVQQANAPNGHAQLSEIEIAHKTDELLCAYTQAYAKAYMKKRFLFPTRPSEGVSDFRPKHCQKSHCLCQYIEQEHFTRREERKASPWYERVFSV